MGKKIQITESQLQYIVKNINRVNEQVGPKDIIRFKAAVSRIKAANDGINIFTKGSGKPTPIQLVPDRVSAIYDDNMVTIEGTKNSPQLIEQLDKTIESLLNTPGFDPTKVVMSVHGTANAENPTTQYKQKYSHLDHTDSQPYGGIDVSKEVNYYKGNLYLAKNRANGIANYIKEKIPGIQITPTGEVLPGLGESDKNILLGAKYKDEVQEPKVFGLPKILVSNNLKIQTGEQIGVNNETNNKNSGVPSQNAKRRFYSGTRTIKLVPAGKGTPIILKYYWNGSMGDNPFESSKTTKSSGGSAQRKGAWTGTKTGNENKKSSESGAYEKMVLALKTSGFIADESQATQILAMFADGENQKVQGITTIKDFKKFISTMGGGGSSFSLRLAEKNGAYLIDVINSQVTGGK